MEHFIFISPDVFNTRNEDRIFFSCCLLPCLRSTFVGPQIGRDFFRMTQGKLNSLVDTFDNVASRRQRNTVLPHLLVCTGFLISACYLTLKGKLH